MTLIAVSDVDLARIQFGMTSIYHFLFVPLTLGLAPLVAVMQTAWHRTGNEAWLRLTKFFGTLLLINFAIGVATGLVQEFQFGMNWSAYSKFVGGVFGAPLAIEGLAAFALEATFLGLWIFGWDRLSPRVHLATIWLVALGTWLSAYFILVANSWMQHPVGYKLVDGEAHLTDVWALLSNPFALRAYLHVLLVGLTTGSIVVLGISCWHLLRGRDTELFRRAAALALIVAVPVTLLNLIVGNRFGEAVTGAQSMKIAAAEALWDTEQPAGFSLFQIGGFSAERPDAERLDHGPEAPVVHGDRLVRRRGAGHEPAPGPGGAAVRRGQLHPGRRGHLLVDPGDGVPRVAMFLVAAVGAWLYRKRRLEKSRWFLRTAIAAMAAPVHRGHRGLDPHRDGTPALDRPGAAEDRGRPLAEREPAMIAVSLGVFATLYVVLGVVDFVLMRRYARIDPPERRRVAEPPARAEALT